MIYIHPVGGLGNMFFHIASIYSLAKDNNDNLSLLNIDKKINDLINEERCDLKHANDYRFIFERLPNYNGDLINKIQYDYEYKTLEYKNECEYVGYFQTEKYFKHRRTEIIDLLKPNDKINEKLEKYSNLFGNVSIHVRRNDYVKLYPTIHIPQNMDYYNRAMNLFPENNLKYCIFTDDIEWCKNNFIGDNFIFIDEIDYVSIYLMSKMKYHIIANSTFSWWGAWLSEYEEKIVIAPKLWFGGRKLGFDEKMKLIPENWIKI